MIIGSLIKYRKDVLRSRNIDPIHLKEMAIIFINRITCKLLKFAVDAKILWY